MFLTVFAGVAFVIRQISFSRAHWAHKVVVDRYCHTLTCFPHEGEYTIDPRSQANREFYPGETTVHFYGSRTTDKPTRGQHRDAMAAWLTPNRRVVLLGDFSCAFRQEDRHYSGEQPPEANRFDTDEAAEWMHVLHRADLLELPR